MDTKDTPAVAAAVGGDSQAQSGLASGSGSRSREHSAEGRCSTGEATLAQLRDACTGSEVGSGSTTRSSSSPEKAKGGASASEPSSAPSLPEFVVGDRVNVDYAFVCKSVGGVAANPDTNKTYEAKVQNKRIDPATGNTLYLVHYIGWNRR